MSDAEKPSFRRHKVQARALARKQKGLKAHQQQRETRHRDKTGLAGTRIFDITPDQYEKGWQVFSTTFSPKQVMIAAQLTRPQLEWVVKTGDAKNGMPSYEERMIEEVQSIRAQAKEAGTLMSKGGVQVLTRIVENAKLANTLVHMLMQDYIGRLVANAQKPTADQKPIDEILPGRTVTDALKVLKPYVDLSSAAIAFHTIYQNPHPGDPQAKFTDAAKLNLSGASAVPAALAMLEEAKGTETKDLLNDLIPQYRDWSPEELRHYAETGELPDHELVTSK